MEGGSDVSGAEKRISARPVVGQPDLTKHADDGGVLKGAGQGRRDTGHRGAPAMWVFLGTASISNPPLRAATIITAKPAEKDPVVVFRYPKR